MWKMKTFKSYKSKSTIFSHFQALTRANLIDAAQLIQQNLSEDTTNGSLAETVSLSSSLSSQSCCLQSQSSPTVLVRNCNGGDVMPVETIHRPADAFRVRALSIYFIGDF